MTFDDRSKPVSLKTEWSALLANSTQFHALMPELARYLSTYPKQPLAVARDLIYWIRENYGVKPISKTVTSIVHGVIYTPPSQTGRTIVASLIPANSATRASTPSAILFVTGLGIHFAMRLSSHWPRLRS